VTTKELSLMPHRIRRRPGFAGCLILVVASLVLAACGGSSKPSTNASATTTTGGPGGGASRFTALRTCLAKNGITLPQAPAGRVRPPGGAPRTGGIFGGAGAGASGATGAGRRGFQPPAGVSAAKFQAAVAKCGGTGFGGGAGAARRTLTPAQKATQQAALVKFAACMKTNGVTLPAPNTSGNGPVFNTSKLNTTSPQFVAATKKCMSLLPARFGRRGGGGGPGQPGTATTTTPTTTTAQ
jgi:hypothetical protein